MRAGHNTLRQHGQRIPPDGPNFSVEATSKPSPPLYVRSEACNKVSATALWKSGCLKKWCRPVLDSPSPQSQSPRRHFSQEELSEVSLDDSPQRGGAAKKLPSVNPMSHQRGAATRGGRSDPVAIDTSGTGQSASSSSAPTENEDRIVECLRKKRSSQIGQIQTGGGSQAGGSQVRVAAGQRSSKTIGQGLNLDQEQAKQNSQRVTLQVQEVRSGSCCSALPGPRIHSN